MFPVNAEDGLITINSENSPVEHNDVIDTLLYLIGKNSTYKNKKLIILDPGSDYNPTDSEMLEFINMLKILLDDTFPKVALVVTKPLHFGLGRMTEILAESVNGKFRVFKEEQKARDWLSD